MYLRSVPAVLALCALPLFSQSGNGGNGDIDITPLAYPANVTLTITGTPGASFSVYYSDAPAVIGTIFGTVWIDVNSPNFVQFISGNLDGTGTASATAFVPGDPGLLFIQGAVAGGHPSGYSLTRAIRIDFEPADSFAALPAMTAPRALCTGDTLKDGRVFVAGGGNGTILAPVATQTTEIYQPYYRTWIPGPNTAVQRSFQASVVLNDGRVLLTGGSSSSGVVTTTCEVFNPVTNTMSNVASMGTPRAGHAATLLANGKVLVTGGTSTFAGTAFGPILNGASDSGEVYDPVANAWAPVGNVMASKRFVHSQTLLANGNVLVVSGLNGTAFIPFIGTEYPTFTATCSIYNPTTNMFTAAASITNARAAHRATLMGNGEVFVGGGVVSVTFVPTATNDSRKYNPTTNTWSSAGLLPASIALQGQVLLRNGVLHISGGATGNITAFSATNVCETRTAGATTFTSTNAMPDARGFHVASRLADGSILIAGGGDSVGAALATAYVYTPVP